MERVKENTVRKWIRNYEELSYEPCRGIIHCSKCETHFKAKKYIFVRHVAGAVHTGKARISPLDFYFDLIEFLILSNIPWSELDNPAFRQFLKKYICCKCADKDRTIPTESLLRKVYLTKLYDSKIKEIHTAIGHNKIWVSVDETTDYMGRNILHILVKPLTTGLPIKTYLLASKILDVVNGKTVAQFVEESLRNMWQNYFEINLPKVLMLCTDHTFYMLSAGCILKTIFPNLKHVTCLSRALQSMAEKMPSKYKNVAELITNVKKVFSKAPDRIKILKLNFPDMPLPPKPDTTKWETWLEAAFYYNKYYNEMTHVLLNLNSNEAQSIHEAKTTLLQDPNIRRELEFIEEHFRIINIAIENLQTSPSLKESLEIFDEVRTVLNWSEDETVINEIEELMDENPDLDVIREFSDNIESSLEGDLAEFYKFAPLTSIDVERSFAGYKWIVNGRRNCLKADNIGKIMVIYYNSEKSLSDTQTIESDSE